MAQSRDEKKFLAIRRAEFRLQQRLEQIDWEEDVLLPELKELGAGGVLALPSSQIVELEYEDEE